MLRRLLSGVGIVLALALPGAASGAQPELPGFGVSFKLGSSHGYTVLFGAFSVSADGRGYAAVLVRRRGASATYRVPATVTRTGIEADFGRLGRVEVVRRASGRTKVLRSKCIGRLEFEPAIYEGTMRFRGEGGFVQVDRGIARERTPSLDTCPGSGRSEGIGGGYPGARLKGVSYANGRVLRFQFNKNRPRGARVAFSASVAERRGRLRVDREVHGATRPNAFTFSPDLSTARLRL